MRRGDVRLGLRHRGEHHERVCTVRRKGGGRSVFVQEGVSTVRGGRGRGPPTPSDLCWMGQREGRGMWVRAPALPHPSSCTNMERSHTGAKLRVLPGCCRGGLPTLIPDLLRCTRLVPFWPTKFPSISELFCWPTKYSGTSPVLKETSPLSHEFLFIRLLILVHIMVKMISAWLLPVA